MRQLSPLVRPSEIAAWIMFGSQQRKRPVLIAEGKSDVHVYAQIVNPECRLFYAEGKDCVLSVMKIIRAKPFPGVVAIIDADFGRLCGDLGEGDDVICTDTHDIESLTIKHSGFGRFLIKHQVYVSSSIEFSFAGLQKVTGDLQRELLSIGSVLGYIRLISARAALRFDFKVLRHEAIFHMAKGHLEVNMSCLETEIMGRCNTANSKAAWPVIMKHIEQHRAANDDLWQVCCGHDLANLLVIYLRSRSIQINLPQVEADLLLTFDTLDFTTTRMYSKLVQWETRNPGYLLLRRPTEVH